MPSKIISVSGRFPLEETMVATRICNIKWVGTRLKTEPTRAKVSHLGASIC